MWFESSKFYSQSFDDEDSLAKLCSLTNNPFCFACEVFKDIIYQRVADVTEEDEPLMQLKLSCSICKD